MTATREQAARWRATHCCICTARLAPGLKYRCMRCRLMLRRVVRLLDTPSALGASEPTAVRRGRQLSAAARRRRD